MINQKKIISVFVFCSLLYYTANAIEYLTDSLQKDTIVKQKDISDIGKQLFHLKTTSVPDSVKVKPGKLLFAIVPGFGYTIQTGLTFVTTLNLSFFTDKSKNANLSVLRTMPEASFTHHQILLPLILDLWSKENKYNWLGDWHYYKYPTYTYGLGGHTQLSDADHVSYSYIRAYQEVLKQVKPDFFIGLGYNLDIHDNITEDGVGNGILTDYRKYSGNVTRTISSGASIHILYDKRRNSNNPEGGFFYSIFFRPNMKVLGSDDNWQNLTVDLRKYIPFSKNRILAFWNYNWLTFGGKAPYFDLPFTQGDTYDNIGRGYVQGRFTSRNMFYFEAEYRYGILKNGLIGGVVFANAQCVSEWPSNSFETILPGVGTGLRFKLNKLSRVNFALDYAWGIGGSQGFFFDLCEAF